MEPIGGLRGDWQAASICSMQANVAAARSGSERRFRVQDFMLEYGDERPAPAATEVKREKSWQELKFIAQMWVAESNAKR